MGVGLLPWFVAVAAVPLAVCVACDGGTTRPDATQATTTSTPLAEPTADHLGFPALDVSLGDVTVRAGVGASCWHRLPCGDTGSVITQRTPLAGRAGAVVVARPSVGPPSEASAQAWRINDLPCDPATLREEGPEGCGIRVVDDSADWLGYILYERLPPPERLATIIEADGVSIASPSQPGLYVASVQLRFEERGTVSYGLLLDLADEGD